MSDTNPRVPGDDPELRATVEAIFGTPSKPLAVTCEQREASMTEVADCLVETLMAAQMAHGTGQLNTTEYVFSILSTIDYLWDARVMAHSVRTSMSHGRPVRDPRDISNIVNKVLGRRR